MALVAGLCGSAAAIAGSSSDCPDTDHGIIQLDHTNTNGVIFPGRHGFIAAAAHTIDADAVLAGRSELNRNCTRHVVPAHPGDSIWFAFAVSAERSLETNWVLALDEPQIATMIVHEQLPNGVVRVKRNGHTIPDEARDMQLVSPVVGLAPATSGITRYAVRIDTGGAPLATLRLSSLTNLQNRQITQLVMICTFLGFLAAIALYNLNLFFNLRIAAAPFYILYIIFIGIHSAAYEGLFFWITPWAWPEVGTERLVEAFCAGAALWLTQFARHLLRLPSVWPTGDRIAKFVIIALVPLLALALIKPAEWSWPLHLHYVVGLLTLAVLAHVRAKQGDEAAKFYQLGLLVFFLGIAVNTTLFLVPPLLHDPSTADLLADYGVQSAMFYLGVCGEAVLMSFAVLAHVRQRRAEALQAAADGRQPGTAPFDDKARKFLDALNETVSDNIADAQFDVSALAGHMATSERTLRRRLHETVGKTPAEYIRDCRMAHARKLIRGDAYGTVAEVARAVGLGHAGHFARLYKQTFGISPKDDLATPSSSAIARGQ